MIFFSKTNHNFCYSYKHPQLPLRLWYLQRMTYISVTDQIMTLKFESLCEKKSIIEISIALELNLASRPGKNASEEVSALIDVKSIPSF